MKPVDPRLLRYARGARVFLALSVLLGAAGAGLVIAQAVLITDVVAGAFQHGHGLGALRGELTLLAAVALGRAGVAWGTEAAAHRASAGVKSELRGRLLAHAAALGAGGAGRSGGGGRSGGAGEDQRAGELAALAVRGVDALDSYFSRYLPQLVLAVVVPAAVLLRILAADWLSAVIVLCTLPLIPVFMVLIGLATQARTDRQWTVLARLSHHFLDVAEGMPTLKVFGRAQAQVESVRRVTAQYRKAVLRTLRLAFLSSFALELLSTLSVALVAVAIGTRLVDGSMTLHDGLLVLVLAPEAYLPLRQVGTHYHASAEGLAAAERVFAVLETPLPRRGDAPAPGEADTAPRIELDRVTVRHAGRAEAALEEVSLVVEAGETVALVGPSGVGKTTLLAAVLGFAEPEAGEVRVDDVPVRRIAPEAWHARIAWVPQRPRLFAGTVAENVRLARPDATEEQVEAALRAAGAWDFVRALPGGAATPLGEDGAGLSAGQRQRLALARAFLADRPVVLLDEPTANLDAESEAAVVAAVRALARGRTVLLTAHRPAILAAAHRVVALRPRAGGAGPDTLAAATAAGAPGASGAPARSAPAALAATAGGAIGAPGVADAIGGPAGPVGGLRASAVPPARGPASGSSAAAGLPAAAGSADAADASAGAASAAGAAGVAAAGGAAAAARPARPAAAPVCGPPATRPAGADDVSSGSAPAVADVAASAAGRPASVGATAAGAAGGPRTDGVPAGGASAQCPARSAAAPRAMARVWAAARDAGAGPRLAGAAALGALALGCAIALLGTSGWLISRASQEPPILYLMVSMTLVRAFGMGRSFFRYCERLVAHDAVFRGLGALRAELVGRLARLAPAGHLWRRGDLLSRLVEDVDAVQDHVLRFVLPAASGALAAVASAVAVGVLLPSAGIALAAGLLLAGAAVPALASRLSRRAEHALAPARAGLTTEVVDLLHGGAELAVAGAVPSRLARLRAADARLTGLAARSSATAGLGAGLVALATGLTVTACAALGVAATHSGRVHGVLLAVLVLTPLAAFEAVAGLPAAAQARHRGHESAARLAEIADAPAPVREPEPGRAAVLDRAASPLPVRVRGLTVRHVGHEETALQGLDLDLAAGRRVAVVGPSGSGKTTLAHALLRFVEPAAGRVTLGPAEVDATALESDAVRRVVGLCAQDAHVFDSSLRANLRLARPDGTGDADLWEALDAARLGDWVRTLPSGLDTLVGEHGARLSGGQRQRLALARALLAGFPLLVLDEPAEHLDLATADALTADLLEATRGRATLLITHRLAGLEAVDEIVVLDRGRVVERGTFAELAAREDGALRALLEREREADALLTTGVPAAA